MNQTICFDYSNFRDSGTIVEVAGIYKRGFGSALPVMLPVAVRANHGAAVA